jgi:hypothetical protein
LSKYAFTDSVGSWVTATSTGDVWGFRIADTSAVPLPAAAWLLLSGLSGIGAMARRRRATVPA